MPRMRGIRNELMLCVVVSERKQQGKWSQGRFTIFNRSEGRL